MCLPVQPKLGELEVTPDWHLGTSPTVRQSSFGDELGDLTISNASRILVLEVVSSFSFFRFPEHKSAHLKFPSSYAKQPLRFNSGELSCKNGHRFEQLCGVRSELAIGSLLTVCRMLNNVMFPTGVVRGCWIVHRTSSLGWQ